MNFMEHRYLVRTRREVLTLPGFVEEAVAEEVTLELGLKAIIGGDWQKVHSIDRTAETKLRRRNKW